VAALAAAEADVIVSSNFAEMAAKLAGKAALLSQAEAESRHLARRDAPRRWRRAVLLWPLFTRG